MVKVSLLCKFHVPINGDTFSWLCTVFLEIASFIFKGGF